MFSDQVEVITNVACKFYGVTTEEALSKDKHDNRMKVRRMIQYIANERFGNACPLHIIGYLTGGFDHASVRNNCNKMQNLLHEKTVLGKYMYPDVRNEYQQVRGYAIYELAKLESENAGKQNTDRMSIWLGSDEFKRLTSYCKSTGISKSMFARTLIINELNNIQNGLRVR